MNAHQALHDLFARTLTDRNVHILGEMLEMSPATRGLMAIAPERVHLLPAADASLVGVGVGLAMSGARPVIELSGPAALWGALQQLAQEAAPLRCAGEFSAPLVLRIPLSPGESLPAGVLERLEGVIVACPSDADDAVCMMQAALDAADPVVLVEPREILGMPVREASPPSRPLTEARILREGTDVTVLAWGPAVGVALASAEVLAQEGISAEVIDLRVINPVDAATIGESVRRTGRPVLVGAPEGALLAAVRTAFLRLESPPTLAEGTVPSLAEAIRRAVHY